MLQLLDATPGATSVMNTDKNPTTATLEQEADALERALSRSEDAWLELKEENRRLRAALVEARKFVQWPAGADELKRVTGLIDDALAATP